MSVFSSLYEEELISNPFDYARITDVEYKAELVDEPNSKGKVLITERLTFDIHAASKDNLFWELWRDLPENYVDGVKVQYKVNSVKQIVEGKPDILYEKSPKLYWYDSDYTNTYAGYGPEKWYHSKGPYDEDKRQYECVLFYVDGLYREKVVFEIEYEMYNATLHYNDSSELYLSMYSGDTIKHLNSYKGEILIPNKDMPNEGNYTVYTYGTNSNTFPFTESTTKNPGYHTFSFELNESQLKFSPYNKYIEFALVSFGEDKHIFSEYSSKNDYYYSNVLSEIREEQEKYVTTHEKYQNAKIVVFLIASIGAFLIVIYSFKKVKKIKEKYTFYEPTMQMDYFRDIPSNLDPTFASALVFCKHTSSKKDVKDEYAAILLSLVRKGYIELERINNTGNWDFYNINIIVKHNPRKLIPGTQNYETINSTGYEPLTLTEEYYLNLIIRHSNGNEIKMSSFQSKVSYDYDNTNTFVKNIENSVKTIGTSNGYFQNNNYDEPKTKIKSLSKKFLILGIIIMVLVNIISYQTRLDLAYGAFFILGFAFIISSLELNKLSKNCILLTQFGEDEYVKWRGLYNFLNSETLMNERTVIELPIWEQYLVYATAFGISDKVIKAINIRCPDVYSSPLLSNQYYRSTNFYHSSRSFRTATRTASYTARSGGYGGHGGYGGGGRGGGGGRRRSLIYNTKTSVIFYRSFLFILYYE